MKHISESIVGIQLEAVRVAARKLNKWEILAAERTHPGGNGRVPNGVVMFRRRRYPLPGKDCGTAAFFIRRDGVKFGAGNYDLNTEQAYEDYRERIR